jgi:hypothetical protein
MAHNVSQWQNGAQSKVLANYWTERGGGVAKIMSMAYTQCDNYDPEQRPLKPYKTKPTNFMALVCK